MKFSKAGSLALGVLALWGCESVVHEPDEIQKELNIAAQKLQQQNQQPPALPDEVMAELMLPQQTPVSSVASQMRFSIAADGVEASAFFASLVEGTPYSAAIHPEVQGSVTLNLQQITLDEAIDVLQKLYGYDIQRSGNVIQVFPSKLRTQTFPIDYLMLERLGQSRTTINSSSLVDGGSRNSNRNSSSSQSLSDNTNAQSSENSSGQSSTGTVIRTHSESDFWKELEESIRLMVGAGEGKAVIASPQSGLLTVKAMPAELAQIESFISRLQNRVQRQVLLEAKILEVRLSEGYQQGIDWTRISGGATGFTGAFNSPSGAGVLQNSVTGQPSVDLSRLGGGIPGNEIGSLIGGVFSLGYESSNFAAVIDLLKTQGSVNVLSSPRISASNNQKAVIKVGKDEYFVTDVSATTVTGTSTTVTPEVELTPFFEGIALDVTPQIDDLGGVLLHVHPSVTDINEQIKNLSIFQQNFSLPLAQSEIRETDTIVRANSGDVVVIGGLMSTVRQQKDAKVPFFGDLPLIGGLFTNVYEMEEKTELVIMLKPTIVEVNHGLPSLQQSQKNINKWYEDAKRRFD